MKLIPQAERSYSVIMLLPFAAVLVSKIEFGCNLAELIVFETNLDMKPSLMGNLVSLLPRLTIKSCVLQLII